MKGVILGEPKISHRPRLVIIKHGFLPSKQPQELRKRINQLIYWITVICSKQPLIICKGSYWWNPNLPQARGTQSSTNFLTKQATVRIEKMRKPLCGRCIGNHHLLQTFHTQIKGVTLTGPKICHRPRTVNTQVMIGSNSETTEKP